MSSPVLQQLTEQVTRATTVEQSAVDLINGIASRIDAAVAKALENGATAEELQPVSDVSTALNAETDALAAAIEANTTGPQAKRKQ